MTTMELGRTTRPIGWVKAARRAYEPFPEAVRDRISTALTIAAESKTGIKTPKRDIDLVKARLGRLKRSLLQ